ncbi:hypothetical protein CQW23_35187 [Capsicum baccatum]|uniref:Protein TAR1 n=1 Tax=Capsicum baccatum TaxID=33114 RepID=A0A2G2UWR5_CAPBA|nr:hypothetical protein CQW23_35187 [Capsicum baccatum]
MREPRYPLPRVFFIYRRSTGPPDARRGRGARGRLSIQVFLGAFRVGVHWSPAAHAGHALRGQGEALVRGFDNDPSAGSPTETLLRLVHSLNDKVQWTSRDVAGSEPPTSPRSEHFTGSFNRRVRTSLLEQGCKLTARAEHNSRAVRPNAPSMHPQHRPKCPAIDVVRCCPCGRCKAEASPAWHDIPPLGGAEEMKARRGSCTGAAHAGRRRSPRIGLGRMRAMPEACPESSIHRIPHVRTSSELAVQRAGSISSSPPIAYVFGTGTPVPIPQSQSFSRSYGSILPTSFSYIVPSTRGCSPWRPDAVMSTTGRGRHSVFRIFKGHRERTGHHATCGSLPAARTYLRMSRFQGGQDVKQKRQLFPRLPLTSPDFLTLPSTATSRFRNFNLIPFRSMREMRCLSGFPRPLGSTKPGASVVHMEPFPSSAFKVLI